MAKYSLKKTGNKSSKKKLVIVGLAVLVIAAAVVWVLAYRNQHKTVIPSKTPASQSKSSSNNSSDKSTKTGISTKSSTNSTSSQNSNTTNSAPPLKPWGNFVSNHKPGQNGSPTAETSTCNTSVGATCYIKFTKGSETKTLETKTTDNNGAVIWQWDVKSAGLSVGDWQISAVATINGQTNSSTDSLALEIQ